MSNSPHHASPPREVLLGTCALVPTVLLLLAPATLGGFGLLEPAGSPGGREAMFILAGLALPFLGVWMGIGAIEKGARFSGSALVVLGGLTQAMAIVAGLP